MAGTTVGDNVERMADWLRGLLPPAAYAVDDCGENVFVRPANPRVRPLATYADGTMGYPGVYVGGWDTDRGFRLAVVPFYAETDAAGGLLGFAAGFVDCPNPEPAVFPDVPFDGWETGWEPPAAGSALSARILAAVWSALAQIAD